MSTRSSLASLPRLLLIALLPLACAVGTEPDPASGAPGAGEAGSAAGGGGGSAGSSVVPTAGQNSSGSGGAPSGAFGGTASTGGSGSSSAGAGGTGGKGGSGSGGSSVGGSGGAAAGAGGSGGGGSGCACPKTIMWVDNTSIMWAAGDCLDVAGTKYLYTGTKAQTYANKDCNPTKQMSWCTDMGNDYKFMACK